MVSKNIFICALLSAVCGSALAVNAAGYVGEYNKSYINGWACDKDDPNFQVGVHIWRDDGHFLTGTGANLPRESAVGAACGSAHSNHGFEVYYTVPANLLDNKWHKVQVWLIPNGGDPRQLTNSPVDIYFDSGVVTPPTNPADPYANPPSPRPMKSQYLGHLGPPPQIPFYSWPQCSDWC